MDITAEVVQWITGQLEIPTIGIGAGNQCDGQVLVFHDVLGLFDQFVPKFVKQYAALRQPIMQLIAQTCEEVRLGRFPEPQHSFSMPEDELARLFAKPSQKPPCTNIKSGRVSVIYWGVLLLSHHRESVVPVR